MDKSSQPSVWAPPRLSLRWWPVFARNLLVWRKLAVPSLLANIGEPLLWLVAFGYGLGAMIGRVPTHGQEVPYILFLASGSVCMSAMNAASFEALYSAFSRMHVQKTWDGILNTPVQLDDVVLAEMLWAGFKALFSVTVILAVIWALGITRAPRTLLALPVLLAAGVTFASLALVFNAKARGYDFFTYYFAAFLSPMMFLSGVFFSARTVAPGRARGHRLAAADGRGRTGAPAVPEPVARAALALGGGAGGVCGPRPVGGAGLHAAAFPALKCY